MTYEELFAKYQALILENSRLKDEIVHLNAELEAQGHQVETDGNFDIAPAELFFDRSDETLPMQVKAKQEII